MQLAIKEYKSSPATFNVNKYENPVDNDALPEPLPLAYQEMFKAVELGSDYEYGELNEQLLNTLLGDEKLIQTSIKLKKNIQDY